MLIEMVKIYKSRNISSNKEITSTSLRLNSYNSMPYSLKSKRAHLWTKVHINTFLSTRKL